MNVVAKSTQELYHGGQVYGGLRKIRVLLIITCLGTGGATNVVLDIARYFNQHPDFEVEVLTGPIPQDRTDLTHLAIGEGIPTQVMPTLVNRISPLENVNAVTDLRRVIVQGQYDIVHTHSSVAGVVGRIAARLAGIPVIVHHVHGWGLRADMSSSTRMLYLTLERFCALITNRIVVVSSSDIQKGVSHGIGDNDKYVLIHNGIDLEKFRQAVDEQEMRREVGVDPDAKLVGFIGRLDQQKNPMDFIHAADIVCKRYDNVQFLLVGDGVLRQECEQLIEALQLQEKVLLLGYRSDVERLMPILTLTAMSSLWEGLPLVFLEAMSAGKPIVANDVDGARDVVVEGRTGFLVTPYQPGEMATRILQLLEDEALCTEMGQYAQQRSQDYSVQRMVGELESLYTELYAPKKA